jgi:uncharacterized protein YdhG (YjbR/CyaY superfamily)
LISFVSVRTAPKDIDDYIAGFPVGVQKLLERIRKTIQKAAPDAVEAISYQIPTFKLGGKNMIHFAAFKNHIGLYPAPRGVADFKDELAKYEGGKGTMQFPLDKPIPYDLVTRIVKFRAKENAARPRPKTKKPSS